MTYKKVLARAMSKLKKMGIGAENVTGYPANASADKSKSSQNCVSFKSPDLDFNYFGVKGHLFKQIENKKVYHSQDFHKKFYEINFFDAKLKIFKELTDSKPKEEIALRMITEVRIDFEQEADKKSVQDKAQVQLILHKGQRKRSNSLMNRLFGANPDQKPECVWQFEFILVTVGRTYVFRAPSKEVRQHWYRIFNIIVEMNKENVATNFMNPFDFDQKRKDIELYQE